MVCGRRGVFRPGTPSVFPGVAPVTTVAGSLSVAGRKVWDMETSAEGAAESGGSGAAQGDSPVSVDPATTTEAVMAVEPVTAVQPVTAVEPVTTVEPVMPVQPTATADPVTPVQPAVAGARPGRRAWPRRWP